MDSYGMLAWADVPFQLKSGVESHIYFHGRNDLTDNPQMLRMCGELIGKRFHEDTRGKDGHRIMIGVPTAANGFAASVTHYSLPSFGFDQIGFRVMREKLKGGHGDAAQRGFWVNGRPQSDHLYATIENVVTSGQSLLEALNRLESDGYPVATMNHYVFMDRQQGGVAKVRKSDYIVHTLFELLDVVYILAALKAGSWDMGRYAAVEAEIEAHQVA